MADHRDTFPSLSEEELKRIVDDGAAEFEEAWKKAFGDIENGDQAIRFTRKRWRGIQNMFAMINGRMVRNALLHREKRIELEKRIKALEDRPEFRDAGIYRQGITYQPSEGVSHDGSYWLCRKQTTDKPPSPSWRLIAKRGRNARDGRNAT